MHGIVVARTQQRARCESIENAQVHDNNNNVHQAETIYSRVPSVYKRIHYELRLDSARKTSSKCSLIKIWFYLFHSIIVIVVAAIITWQRGLKPNSID